MKNPFEKTNNNRLITAAVIGGITAMALAYLFLTDDGAEMLGNLKHKVKEGAKNMASALVSDKTGISKRTVKKAAAIIA
jgi:hypothetical protein